MFVLYFEKRRRRDFVCWFLCEKERNWVLICEITYCFCLFMIGKWWACERVCWEKESELKRERYWKRMFENEDSGWILLAPYLFCFLIFLGLDFLVWSLFGRLGLRPKIFLCPHPLFTMCYPFLFAYFLIIFICVDRLEIRAFQITRLIPPLFACYTYLPFIYYYFYLT